MDRHPASFLDDSDRVMVRLYRAWRPSAAGARGYLPFAGGTGDQPAYVMACLEVLEAAEAAAVAVETGA